MSLALKYRPRKFAELHGQESTSLVLSTMVERYFDPNGITLPSGIMLSGPKGSGKTTSARILAASLNCTSPGAKPCGSCVPCDQIFKQLFDAVMEVDGATSGGVDSIRELRTIARLSHSGSYRVIIVDECHAITKEGFSALLKQLEEPPSGVLYILVTTNFNEVPGTITSRCLTFMFSTIEERHIQTRLQEICEAERFVYEPEILPIIARRSDGSLRNAVMLLEHLAITNDLSVERAATLWPDNTAQFALEFLRTAQAGDLKEGMRVIAETFGTLRDSAALFEAISRLLRDRAVSLYVAEKQDGVRTFSTLLAKLWEFRIGTKFAMPTDPTPLEGYWFACSAILAKPAGAGGRAAPPPTRLAGSDGQLRAPAGAAAATNGSTKPEDAAALLKALAARE